MSSSSAFFATGRCYRESQALMQHRANRASGGHRLGQAANAAASARDGIEPEHANLASGEEVSQLLLLEILLFGAGSRSEYVLFGDEQVSCRRTGHRFGAASVAGVKASRRPGRVEACRFFSE